MDCGVPFCHSACPLGNKARSGNFLYKGELWGLAYRLLNSEFPETTGRICPALCEKACVLNLMDHEPTTDREDECAIVDTPSLRIMYMLRFPERRGGIMGPCCGLVAAKPLEP